MTDVTVSRAIWVLFHARLSLEKDMENTSNPSKTITRLSRGIAVQAVSLKEDGKRETSP